MPFITSDIWVIFPDHQKCEKNNFGIITNSKKGKEKLLGEIKKILGTDRKCKELITNGSLKMYFGNDSDSFIF